jgi:hypothetical protein
MSRTKRYVKKQAKTIKRRRLNAQDRHAHQQRQAQRDIEALRQALDHLGLPDDLVIEIEGRLRAQKKLLGKIFGLMFPTLFGCRSAHELTRVRGWDKNMPSRILAALPKRSWLKRLRKLGQDILSALWRHIESMCEAPTVAGSGHGSLMTQCFANTGRPLRWWVTGTVANTIAWSAVLMACSCWSSSAMANWLCPLTLLCVAPTLKGRGHAVATSSSGPRSCSTKLSRPSPDAVCACPHLLPRPIAGLATQN